MCRRCRKSETTSDAGDPSQFCIVGVAETVALFLWILSAVEVEQSIKPSPEGLRLLYGKLHEPLNRTLEPWEQRWKVGMEQYFPTHDMDILTAAVIIFSGSAEHLASDGQSSALSRQGICAFFVALEELNSPPIAVSTVRVLPGHIEFGRQNI